MRNQQTRCSPYFPRNDLVNGYITAVALENEQYKVIAWIMRVRSLIDRLPH